MTQWTTGLARARHGFDVDAEQGSGIVAWAWVPGLISSFAACSGASEPKPRRSGRSGRSGRAGKFGRVQHLRTHSALIPLGPASTGFTHPSIGAST